MMSTSLFGQPIFLRIFHNADLLTVSKAFVRSTKTAYNSLMVLATFLLELSGSKDHIHSTTISPESALALW